VSVGWTAGRRRAVACLIEKNRLLPRQLGGRRLRFTVDDRRRLAARAYRIVRLWTHGHLPYRRRHV
jgi:hypothetical protein